MAQADELFSAHIHENLTPKIWRELKKWPFTWEGRKFYKAGGGRTRWKI